MEEHHLCEVNCILRHLPTCKIRNRGLSECFKAQRAFVNKERYVVTIICILELGSFSTLRFTSIYRYTRFHGQMLFK
jgi:hypothetical protein